MPSINVDGTIGNNVKIHKVEIASASMLASMVSTYDHRKRNFKVSSSLTVNSVHWKAPNVDTMPVITEMSDDGEEREVRKALTIAARAQYDAKVAPKGKEPEDDTVEAFEQYSGAPLLGIQWHPEAYNNDGSEESAAHRQILTYMAKAGDAYCAKQDILESLQSEYASIVKNFHHVKSSAVDVDDITERLGKVQLAKKKE
jgi:hypothetical protein